MYESKQYLCPVTRCSNYINPLALYNPVLELIDTGCHSFLEVELTAIIFLQNWCKPPHWRHVSRLADLHLL